MRNPLHVHNFKYDIVTTKSKAFGMDYAVGYQWRCGCGEVEKSLAAVMVATRQSRERRDTLTLAVLVVAAFAAVAYHWS